MSQYLRNQYEVNSRVPYPGDPHAYYSFAQAFNQAAASKQPLTPLQQQQMALYQQQMGFYNQQAAAVGNMGYTQPTVTPYGKISISIGTISLIFVNFLMHY